MLGSSFTVCNTLRKIRQVYQVVRVLYEWTANLQCCFLSLCSLMGQALLQYVILLARDIVPEARSGNLHCLPLQPRAFRASETAFCVARWGVRWENGLRNFECSSLAEKKSPFGKD